MSQENTAANLPKLTTEQMLAKILAENEILKAQIAANPKNKLTLKIGEKGGLSIYGMGKFPVTLYKEQWTRLLDEKDTIVAFLAANDAKLTSKGDTKKPETPEQRVARLEAELKALKG